MKLIDILVEELPKRGGWPKMVTHIGQDYDRELMFYGLVNPRSGIFLEQLAIDHRKHGGAGTKITREQYEVTLTAKNDGWIEWGGGEHPPVSTNTVVDVKFKNGNVQSGYPAGEYSWEHEWAYSNIIAYRLHQPQEAEQAKADDEADLNYCIGQAPVPVWNGKGLPPVGCMCERSWAGDEWQSCKILFASNQLVVVKLKESGVEDAYSTGYVTFRPLRTEAERKRDAAVEQMIKIATIYTTKSLSLDLALNSIYNAIAAGEITGMKLED